MCCWSVIVLTGSLLNCNLKEPWRPQEKRISDWRATRTNLWILMKCVVGERKRVFSCVSKRERSRYCTTAVINVTVVLHCLKFFASLKPLLGCCPAKCPHSPSEISKLQTLLPFLWAVQELMSAHHSLKCEIGSLLVKQQSCLSLLWR